MSNHEYTYLDYDADTDSITNTNNVVRTELTGLLRSYMLEKTGTLYTPEEYVRAIDCLRDATLEQLWRLYHSFVRLSSQFKVLYCTDLLGIQIGTMFVGIEKDGYAHS